MSDATRPGPTRPAGAPGPDEISRLRAGREQARGAVGLAAGRLARARRALRAAGARRPAPGERERLAAEQEQARGALRDARAAEAGARERLTDAVAKLEGSPFDRIGQLDADHPVAFLPVRVETRFRRPPPGPVGAGAGELLVRIYPDAILADDHEPLLNARELAAGHAYWRRAFADGHERDAWTLLLAEATPERAAWIVERTTPANAAAIGTGAAPQLPEPAVRPDGWHRAPEARGLPERWVVSAFRRGERVHQVLSGPVREGLALSLRLSGDSGDAGDADDSAGGGGEAEATAAARDLSGDGLTVDPELAWVYEFEEAVAAGMALRLPLTADDLSLGFDLLLVAGVRTTEPADKQAAQLSALLSAHRYARGLALVPQGTKTNNTADAPSDHPPEDPAGALSFEVARGAPLARPGTDGQRLAGALGVDPSLFDHVRGADRDEQAAARAMVDALWPSTIGYFVSQLLEPDVGPVTVDALRAWARQWLRPRGPLPAFRVGRVPYGVLPVGSLDDWTAIEAEGAPADLPELLKRFGRAAARLTGEPPHVGRSADGDRDLVELLGMDASAQTARIRRALGVDAMWNIMTADGLDLPRWEERQNEVATAIIQEIGEPDWEPRALFLSYEDHPKEYTGPLVQDGPLSETEPLTFDYIAWLRRADLTTLEDQNPPSLTAPVTALLYVMLRHALLLEYDRWAQALLGQLGRLLPFEAREPELVNILPGQEPGGPLETRSAWDRFAMDIPGVGTIGEFLTDPGATAPTPEAGAVKAGLGAHLASLATLEGLPSAELQRLFTETLDAYSHRLDAWITSLATRRLSARREQAPRGVWLGCYGWVENLRPDPPVQTVPVTLPDGTPASARTDSGGYVYAPSMLHGATAAVLRSAWLARSGPEREAYSVDLSSHRVRTAIGLLDAVRERQPLGAVLGYQFERGLHEGHPGVELDRFIDTFRSLYPPVANKARDSGRPAAAVAARNVVDGLRLLQAWQGGTVPWGSGELTPTAAERAAIEAELERLDDAVDALGDLLLGESVFQVVKGSVAGAAATLDTLAKGQRPPAPELATVPRSGTALHQRVALVLGDATPAPGWEQVAATPRSAASAELNAWLGELVGDPAAVECRVTPEGDREARTVRLRDLGLQPLDLLAVANPAGAAEASGPPGGGTGGGSGHPAAPAAGGLAELDRRIAWHVAGDAGPDTAVTIDYDRAGSEGALPFAAAFELASTVARVLGFGRPLQAGDLLPAELAGTPAADPMAAELETRAAAAREQLSATRGGLAALLARLAPTPPGAPDGRGAGTRAGVQPSSADLAALRADLAAAAGFGVPGAFPASRHDTGEAAVAALLAQARGAGAELGRRHAAAVEATDAAAVLRAVFGRGFPVVPRFRPAMPELLAPALAAEPELGPAPDATVEGWLAQLARVRPQLDAWRDLQLYGRALGRALTRPRIAQLPLETGPGAARARWAALTFGDESNRPRSGLVSLALLGEAPPAADAPWAGLLLDTWPELLPSREEDAGVVFHYDAPRAQAPQAVLLAVPPGPARTWSWEHLERTLLHALDLAKVRALDLHDLWLYGQIVPMTFLAANTLNQTVATSFKGLVGEPAEVVTDRPTTLEDLGP
ncbi:MAG TPA: hypothetical protein VKG45_14505 [Actinomycetes bacterium]|nr:hypothetical protein [Actinomycetes bacterium]